MISYKPSEALGTADSMGLPLGLGDLIRYFMGRLTKDSNAHVGDSVVKSASRHLGLTYALLSKYPRFYNDLIKEGHLLFETNPNEELVEKLAIYQPQTVTEDYLYRKMVPSAFRGDERGLTDMVSWTDPQTGQQYRTNYGTVQKTHDALAQQALKRKTMMAAPLLGGGALLGGASLAMGLHPRTRGIPQLITGLGGLGLGSAGGYQLFKSPETTGPRIRTDQGETISGYTEMMPKRASALSPEIYYILRRSHDKIGPQLPTKYAEDFFNSMKTAEIHDELSQFVGPTLDLDLTSQTLGNSILKWVE
jgi:hypothetical protein